MNQTNVSQQSNPRSILKALTRGAYDLQKLRIQSGNRVVAAWKAKLGQAPSESESTLDPESQELLKKIRASYKLVTDGVILDIIDDTDVESEIDEDKKKAKTVTKLILELLNHRFNILTEKKKKIPATKADFPGDPIISEYSQLCLVNQYGEFRKSEAREFRNLEKVLVDFPIYTEFLRPITGCGEAMSAVIISEFDIHKAKYPSSLHMYCGLDVAPDGLGRSKKGPHLVLKPYKKKDGTMGEKLSITFNPFLKTKMVGVLAPSFIRCKSPYGDLYYNYKNRLENHPSHQGKSKGHKHAMSLRYMLKIFLIDLYASWRKLEGLEVAQPYHVAKLGLSDHRKDN